MANKYLDKDGLTQVWSHVTSYAGKATTPKTTEAIEVAGGPLADDTTDNWPWYDGDKRIIPANKSVQEVLSGLFLKVINGTVSKGSPTTWNPTNTAPSASIPGGNRQVVGTTRNITFSANQNVTGNNRSITVTATQGYFLNDSTTHSSGNYVQTKNGTVSGTAVATATYKEGNKSAVSVFTGDSVVIGPGTNTLSVSQSGITASISKFDTATVYASTNTKTKLSANVVVEESADPSDKQLTNSNSASVTGYYPVYYKQFARTDIPASDITAELLRSGSTNDGKLSSITINDGTGTFFMAIPASNATDYAKTSIELMDPSSKDVFGASQVTTLSDVQIGTSEYSQNYKVFYISNKATWSGAATFNITLK